MTVTTARPKTTTQEGNWIKEPSGASSFYGLIDDEPPDINTYVIGWDIFNTNAAEAVVGFGQVIGGTVDAKIRAVRTRVYIGNSDTGMLLIGQRYNNASRYDEISAKSQFIPTGKPGPWHKLAPDNSPWDFVIVNQMKLALRTGGINGDPLHLYEVYLDIEHYEPPALTIDTAATVAISYPPITWTHTHPDGFDQLAYELEILQGGEIYWKSGIVRSQAQSRVPDTVLYNGAYTTRLRVSSDWGSTQELWSPWVEKSLTVDAPIAVAPTADTYEGIEPGSVRIEITPGGGTPEAEFFTVERSVDQENWTTVVEEATADSPLNVYDFAAIPKRLAYYRVSAIRYISGDKIVTAPVEDSITYELHEWVLRDHTGELGYMTLDVEQSDLDIEWGEDKAAFNPLGRVGDNRKTGAIVVKDTLRGDKFSVTAGMIGTEAYDKFVAFRFAQRTLVLQAPVADCMWYFVFGSPIRHKILNMNEPVYRQITFEVIEVDNVSH